MWLMKIKNPVLNNKYYTNVLQFVIEDLTIRFTILNMYMIQNC